MILLITISVIIYILSFLSVRTWIRIAHSKGGIYSNCYPEGIDFLVTILPMINTGMALMNLGESPYRDRNGDDFLTKFFGIKK